MWRNKWSQHPRTRMWSSKRSQNRRQPPKAHSHRAKAEAKAKIFIDVLSFILRSFLLVVWSFLLLLPLSLGLSRSLDFLSEFFWANIVNVRNKLKKIFSYLCGKPWKIKARLHVPSTSPFFSCASAKAERSLSSLSCVWMYVDQNLGNPPARISWIHTKMLHHFCMTPNLPMTKKTPPPWLNCHGCIW